MPEAPISDAMAGAEDTRPLRKVFRITQAVCCGLALLSLIFFVVSKTAPLPPKFTPGGPLGGLLTTLAIPLLLLLAVIRLGVLGWIESWHRDKIARSEWDRVFKKGEKQAFPDAVFARIPELCALAICFIRMRAAGQVFTLEANVMLFVFHLTERTPLTLWLQPVGILALLLYIPTQGTFNGFLQSQMKQIMDLRTSAEIGR